MGVKFLASGLFFCGLAWYANTAQAQRLPTSPSIVRVSPTHFTTATGTLSLEISDPDGPDDINRVFVLFSPGRFNQRCLLEWQPALNRVTLRRIWESSFGWDVLQTATGTLGASGSLTNDYCSVSLAQSLQRRTENSFVLQLNTTQAGVGEQDNRSVFVQAMDRSQAALDPLSGGAREFTGVATWRNPRIVNDAWVAMPFSTNFSPLAAITPISTFAPITIPLQHEAGFGEIQTIEFSVAEQLTDRIQCRVSYDVPTRSLRIGTGPGDTWSEPVRLRLATRLAGEHCVVNVAETTAWAEARGLILSTPVEFRAAMMGTKVVRFRSRTAQGFTAWKRLGQVQVRTPAEEYLAWSTHPAQDTALATRERYRRWPYDHSWWFRAGLRNLGAAEAVRGVRVLIRKAGTTRGCAYQLFEGANPNIIALDRWAGHSVDSRMCMMLGGGRIPGSPSGTTEWGFEMSILSPELSGDLEVVAEHLTANRVLAQEVMGSTEGIRANVPAQAILVNPLLTSREEDVVITVRDPEAIWDIQVSVVIGDESPGAPRCRIEFFPRVNGQENFVQTSGDCSVNRQLIAARVENDGLSLRLRPRLGATFQAVHPISVGLREGGLFPGELRALGSWALAAAAGVPALAVTAAADGPRSGTTWQATGTATSERGLGAIGKIEVSLEDPESGQALCRAELTPSRGEIRLGGSTASLTSWGVLDDGLCQVTPREVWTKASAWGLEFRIPVQLRGSGSRPVQPRMRVSRDAGTPRWEAEARGAIFTFAPMAPAVLESWSPRRTRGLRLNANFQTRAAAGTQARMETTVVVRDRANPEQGGCVFRFGPSTPAIGPSEALELEGCTLLVFVRLGGPELYDHEIELAFAPEAAGDKVVEISFRDGTQESSAIYAGTFRVESPGAPEILSVTQEEAGGDMPNAKRWTILARDPNGAEDVEAISVFLTNAEGDFAASCSLSIFPRSQAAALTTDDATERIYGESGAKATSPEAALRNSQCTLPLAPIRTEREGETLRLSFVLEERVALPGRRVTVSDEGGLSVTQVVTP